MGKCVTERPRTKGAKYKAVRRRNAVSEDESANAQGMRRPYNDGAKAIQKTFTDLLGPLSRFLQSRVGQPWRKVHKEIAGNLKGRNTQQQHILDHLKQMVVTDLAFEDGKLVHANGTPFKVYGHWKEFYVDPRDLILKVVTDKQRAKWKDNRTKLKEAEDELKTKDGQIFRRVEGIWFSITTETETVKVQIGNTERWVEQNVEKKRQLNTEELRKRGLANRLP